MVQNKKIGARLVLIAGLLGMCVSDAALALPEVTVGSHVVAQTQSVESDDAAVTDETETVVYDDDAPSTTN